MVSGKGLRQAVKSRKAQDEVWQEVDNEQGKLSNNLARSIHEASSRGRRGADASRVFSSLGAEAYLTVR
jgi:uncharacterized protein (UPF0218 family)